VTSKYYPKENIIQTVYVKNRRLAIAYQIHSLDG